MGFRICCGHRTSVKFWKDLWLGEVSLALTFPNLFEMVADQDAYVSSQFQDNVSFQHPLSSTRLHMLALLIGILRGHAIRNSPDRVNWKAGAVDYFTARSQYELLQPQRPQDKAESTFGRRWLLLKSRSPHGLQFVTGYQQASTYKDVISCCLPVVSSEITTWNHLPTFFLSCPFVVSVWASIVSVLALHSWPTTLRNMWEN